MGEVGRIHRGMTVKMSDSVQEVLAWLHDRGTWELREKEEQNLAMGTEIETF